MTIFNVTVDAGCATTTSMLKSAGKRVSVSSTGAVTVNKASPGALSEAVAFPWVYGGLGAAYGLSVSGASTFNFSAGGASYTWIAGAEIVEALSVDGSLGVNQVLKHILAQQFGLTELLVLGMPVTLSQSMNVAQSITVVLGALIAERLNLVETNAPSLTYKQTILEYIAARDGLAKFLAQSLMETMNVAPAYIAAGAYKPVVAQSMNVAQTVGAKLIAIATVPESLALDDAQVIQSIFKPTISEVISFDIGVIDPGGGFTTWAVNARTGATTEYQNYAFNSFASSGHRYLGASSSGLYVLDGDDDDGTPTVATLRSGYSQFGGSRYSSFKAAYLGMRGDGDIFLKLESGSGDSYTYQVKLQSQETTKVRIGKGLRARYFAWELVTSGQDFDLDSVEFVPLVAQRRV
jgi:hypothetical protein